MAVEKSGLSDALATAGIGQAPSRGKAGLTRRGVLISGLAALTASVVPREAAAADAIVTNVADYRTALRRLSSRYPAALVDIGADWCAFCKTIDSRILPDPRVRLAMARVALVKVDVTRIDGASRALLKYLHADGPPTVFLVETARGDEYPESRSVGAFRVEHLLRRLRPFA